MARVGAPHVLGVGLPARSGALHPAQPGVPSVVPELGRGALKSETETAMRRRILMDFEPKHQETSSKSVI